MKNTLEHYGLNWILGSCIWLLYLVWINTNIDNEKLLNYWNLSLNTFYGSIACLPCKKKIPDKSASADKSMLCSVSLLMNHGVDNCMKKKPKKWGNKGNEKINPNLCKDLSVSPDGAPSPTRWQKLFWTHVYWPYCWMVRPKRPPKRVP